MTSLLLSLAISESTPAHGPLPDGLVALGDAALRAVLVALVVGIGLRLVARRNVVAQKAAWGLVLAGAFVTPFVLPWAARLAWLPSEATIVVPAQAWWSAAVSRLKTQQPATGSGEARGGAELAKETAAAGTISGATAGQMNRASNPDRTSTAAYPAQAGAVADRFPAPTISHSDAGGARPLPALPGYFLPVSELLWLLYGGVAAALVLRLFYGVGAAVELWQSSEPVEMELWPDRGEGLRVRMSRRISSPVTVGSGVVLPADYDEWDTEKLRIVLAHEGSHVRQGDFYLQALAGLYAALVWFSPLGWWLKGKLSDLSEAISDRAGLDEAASHTSYAQILLEFAALPRPTEIGVAMARKGRISYRIERLLNENSFRQAFAGGRRRMLAALVLVPVALFAATALVRVQAAQTLQEPAATQGAIVGQSHPENAQAAAPAAPTAPLVPPAAPPSEAVPSEPAIPAPPAAMDGYAGSISHHSTGHGNSYGYDSDGDSYAVVGGNDKKHINFSGEWHEGRRAELDKARAVAHGDFLWFTRDGRSYVVDDPQTMAQIQAMYKPMEELGRQMEVLGREQEALGRQQEELGRKQEQASIPTPDIHREMAALNAEVAKLQAARTSSVTQDQLSDLQSRIGDLQGKLGELQEEMGSRMGELGSQQGALGAQQGRLGAQQGRLGAEQGRLGREADRKVKSMIDQSLQSGKARPVE